MEGFMYSNCCAKGFSNQHFLDPQYWPKIYFSINSSREVEWGECHIFKVS